MRGLRLSALPASARAKWSTRRGTRSSVSPSAGQRHGALFQCACVLRWEPERLLDLLALPGDQRQVAWRELAGSGAGVGAERAEAVTAGFLAALPS